MAKIQYTFTKEGKIALPLETILDVIEEEAKKREDISRTNFQFFGDLEQIPSNYIAAHAAIRSIIDTAEDMVLRFERIGEAIERKAKV